MPQHSFSITLAYPPLVKLNNPLMGTEIRIVHTFSPLLRLKRVKLNNPLMGTEILIHISMCLQSCKPPVKLNNPLMGTEIFLE